MGQGATPQGEVIVCSYELRGSRVALTRDIEGFYCVLVQQRGQGRRLAVRDASREVAQDRYQQCVTAMAAINGGHAA